VPWERISAGPVLTASFSLAQVCSEEVSLLKEWRGSERNAIIKGGQLTIAHDLSTRSLRCQTEIRPSRDVLHIKRYVVLKKENQ